MKGIRKCITELADDTLTAQRDLPVYQYPGKYAREHDELELYRASGKVNVACKEAIETAVNGHYNNNCLDTKAAVREVVERFGYERMLYVLAVTVRTMDWDVVNLELPELGELVSLLRRSGSDATYLKREE